MPHDHSVLIEAGLRVLKSHASRGETLTYTEMNSELGEPYKAGADFSALMGKLCDDINDQHSGATGLKLMIAVLVRDDETGLPGEGFFKLAASLGRLPLTDGVDAKRAFVNEQERRVFMVYRPTGPSVSGFARTR